MNQGSKLHAASREPRTVIAPGAWTAMPVVAMPVVAGAAARPKLVAHVIENEERMSGAGGSARVR